jgi:hypothetical protein
MLRTLSLRTLSGALAVSVVLTLAPAASAKPAHKHTAHPHKKRHVTRHWHGYGFLPGYRPPEVIEREREKRYWRSGPYYYWYGWPGYYRGRWNGGSFGPCWTRTPIGPMWNCGK